MLLILGGSFDPVHEGHRHLVERLLAQNSPEQLVLVPARQNPLKKNPGSSPEQRLEMLRLAMAELKDPRLVVDDRELRRAGASYAVDTIREIRRESGKETAFVLGNEVFPDLPRWKDPVALLSETNVIVIAREKSEFRPYLILAALGMFVVREEKGRWYHSRGKWIELQGVDALPISSTRIREEAFQRHASNNFEPMPQGIQRSVWQYIKGNRLYAVSKE